MGMQSSMKAEVVPAQLSEGTSTGMPNHAIMPKELLPIVMTAIVLGDEWRAISVKTRCDNIVVVATIKAGTCKNRKAMHLMRCLAFIDATRSFTV